MREAREVTDDRAHARAAPAPRRQHSPRRVGAAHLARNLSRQLQEVGVEGEEARQAKLADHAELVLQAPLRLPPLGRAAVAILEARRAQLRQLAVGVLVLGARVAVAVIGEQVEPKPLRQPPRLRHRIRILRKAPRHLRRRRQRRAPVSPPERPRLVERRPKPDRHQRVLERRPRRIVRMHVARSDARHPQPLRQAREPPIARHVAPPERALKLYAKAIAPEGPHKALTKRRRPRRIRAGRHPAGALEDPGQRAVASAAGEADEPFGALFEGRERQGRGEGIAPEALSPRRSRKDSLCV